MEKESKVEVTVIKQLCDQCGQGELKNTNITFRCHPPIYLHKCTYCDCEEKFPEKYPKIILPENLK